MSGASSSLEYLEMVDFFIVNLVGSLGSKGKSVKNNDDNADEDDDEEEDDDDDDLSMSIL